MATSKKFSQLPAASSVGNGDLFAIAHEDALAETGYVSQKLTAAQAGQKVNGDTEYPTGLPSFPTGSQNPFDALEKLNADIEALYPISTVSGSIANFTTSLVKPLVALSSTIVAQQAGSGTPSPSNPRSISGFSSVNFYQYGKNLLPNLKFQQSTQAVVLGHDAYAFTTFLKAGTYTFSCDTTTSCSIYYRYSGDSSATTVVGSGSGHKVGQITLSEDRTIRIYAYALDGISASAITSFQIEEGSSDTGYEVYKTPNTFTIALGQTVYGGVVDAKNGKLRVTHFYKQSTWGEGTNATDLGDNIRKLFNFDFAGQGKFPATDANQQKCNVAPYKVNFAEDSNHFYCNANQVVLFMPENTSSDTVVQFVTELATPVEIDITANNFTTFAGENNIFSDCGEVTVGFKQSIQEYIDAQIAATQALIL